MLDILARTNTHKDDSAQDTHYSPPHTRVRETHGVRMRRNERKTVGGINREMVENIESETETWREIGSGRGDGPGGAWGGGVRGGAG